MRWPLKKRLVLRRQNVPQASLNEETLEGLCQKMGDESQEGLDGQEIRQIRGTKSFVCYEDSADVVANPRFSSCARFLTPAKIVALINIAKKWARYMQAEKWNFTGIIHNR